MLDRLDSIKHYLWHGNCYRALRDIRSLVFDLEALVYGHEAKEGLDKPSKTVMNLYKYIGELESYIRNNRHCVSNYGERYRNDERISTGFVESAVTRGYNLQITVASGNRSSEDELSAIEFLRQQKYNVVILSNSHVPENKLLELTEQGIQFIHIGQYVSTFAEHCICIDDEQGAELATRYLIDQGHRYIAHIAFPEFHGHTVSRLNGFRRTLEKAGIAYSEQLIVSPKGFDQTSAFEATEQLLGRNEAFTAIFASTDIMAIGAYKALRQAGLSVPEDVSVVGYDDVDVADFAYPPLTTVRQPIQEMSEAAAHLAISYLKGYSIEKGVVPRFSPQLVVRDSVSTLK